MQKTADKIFKKLCESQAADKYAKSQVFGIKFTADNKQYKIRMNKN